MRTKTWLASLGAALTLGLAASAASAAPAGSPLGAMKGDPASTSAVEQAHWARSCYWRHGHRHCYRRWVRPQVYYGYDYAYPRYYGHSYYGRGYYGHGYYGRRHYGGPQFQLRLW